ncbi:sushi domain-containing protein 2-like [Elysia marginata]|uniref:Sushi domain-containing protein 2-like n=1 Tax=Elysia marginata TaxID=1093978 RepID=A0AAV4F771_9GAST|nr:sushi domain-containing protein 2-like [Elysia marginata]
MASVLKHAGSAAMICVYFLICFAALQGTLADNALTLENPPLLDFGLENGDTKMKDLTQAQEVELPTNISYFGAKYTKLYVSADGLISFERGVQYVKSINWQEGVRNKNTDKPFLAPFLYDGFKAHNIAEGLYKGGIYYRVIDEDSLTTSDKTYHKQLDTLKWLKQYVKETSLNMDDFQANLVIVVTWDNVDSDSTEEADIRACARSPSTCKTSTFQVVLVCDKNLGRTVAMLNYLKMKVPMKGSYQAGFNGGYGRDWYNVIPCHGRCSNQQLDNDVKTYLDILPDLKGSDTVGRFILEVSGETVIRGGCLPKEFTSGILEVYPREVGMFGGEKLEVSGKCLPASSKIFCKFGDGDDGIVVEGIMVNDMKGVCAVPLLTKIGNIFVAWSSDEDSKTWTTDRTISVIHPGRMEPHVSVPQNVKDAWYSRDASEITVVWDPKKFTHTDADVAIKLIGYRETKDKVEYKTLEKTIGRGSVQRGSFTFKVADHRCKSNCLEFEQGLLEVSLLSEYLGVANERVAVRHGVMPLGWYVNEKMTEDNGSDWSNQMCKAWHAEDGRNTDWLSSLLPCPCTLDQALADFGRFQPDAGCNLFAGSKCTYHKKAIHCVRAVVPTSDGAGNQCCYGESRQLVYSQLSYQGSTPDRSHDWGAAPYGKPDLVPSLSHWKHDVVTFYYCCLWNDYDLCDLYMERRPTQDCKHYDLPAVDIGTLSGSKTWSAPVLTSVAIMYKSNIYMDFSLAPSNAAPAKGLDVRVRKQRRFFTDKSTMWQDFEDVSIVNNVFQGQPNEHNNFTVLVSNNVGVNVFSKNGLMHVTVVLPPDMKKPDGVKKGMGLLGTYDGQSANDFMTKTGTITVPGVSQTKFLNSFVMKWGVEDERDSLFPFYKSPTPTDTDFFYADYKEIPSGFTGSPNNSAVEDVCGDDKNCKWDYRITGSANVARTTKASDVLLSYIKESLKQVDSCGLPAVGRNAEMDTTNFSVGSKITVTGCGKGMSFSGTEKYECVREPRSVAEQEDREDYGLVKTGKDDGVEYIIHWVPKPSVLCTASSTGLFRFSPVTGR